MFFATLMLCALPQAPTTDASPRDLAALLRNGPHKAQLTPILAKADSHRLQILLAEPVERPDGTIGLRRSQLGDARQYFYPASSIKLCGAIAALLQLNTSNRTRGTSYGLSTPIAIEPRFAGDTRLARDASNVVDGTLTVEHMLRKLFLVSDNAAYNHCFEITGQDELNRTLWQGGFASVRLWHRLSESRTPEENRQTRAVVLGAGETAVTLPARDAAAKLTNDLWHDLQVGTAYLQGDQRIDHPMSFEQKNAILLADLQDVLIEVVRPEIDTGKRGFPGLTVAQRSFVVHALGELPRESPNPRYDPAKVPDHGCKFVLRGVQQVIPGKHFRVYDKIGRAYGFSVENAYIEDQRTGAGFFLAIVLYTNPDGVLNDDKYAYEELADPFLDAVGATLARAVLPRVDR